MKLLFIIHFTFLNLSNKNQIFAVERTKRNDIEILFRFNFDILQINGLVNSFRLHQLSKAQRSLDASVDDTAPFVFKRITPEFLYRKFCVIK